MKKAESIFSWVSTQKRDGGKQEKVNVLKEEGIEADRKRLKKAVMVIGIRLVKYLTINFCRGRFYLLA